MALIYEKKIFRNLQEQVEKNKQDIVDLQQTEMALNAYGIKVVGQVETALDIPEDFEGDYGDAYLVGDEAPYDVYVWTRPNSETPEDHFVDIGPIAIIGPQGLQGEQGPMGPRGYQGIGWIEYPAEGYTPPNGTFAINPLNGNIYEYSGGTAYYKGSIKGPQGVQGQQGPQGETGATGAQGPQGPKGDTGSSYQVIGTYASTSVLPDPTLVNPGSAALVGADAPYELYIVVGATQDAQQWEDAGVFNEQADSGAKIIEVVISNNAYVGNTWEDYTLSNDQQLLLASVKVTDECYLLVRNTTATGVCQKYICNQFYDDGTNKYMYFVNTRQGWPGFGYTTDPFQSFEAYYTTSTPARLRFFIRAQPVQTTDKKVRYASEIISHNNTNDYYTSTQAVYSYCFPFFQNTNRLNARATISGLPDNDGLGTSCKFILDIYADEEQYLDWLALANNYFNTNYTFSQMITFLQTTINNLGQAVITNKANLIAAIYILSAIGLTTGIISGKYIDGSNNVLAILRFEVQAIVLASSKFIISSIDVSGQNLITLDDYLSEWFTILTDSNPITISITNKR